MNWTKEKWGSGCMCTLTVSSVCSFTGALYPTIVTVHLCGSKTIYCTHITLKIELWLRTLQGTITVQFTVTIVQVWMVAKSSMVQSKKCYTLHVCTCVFYTPGKNTAELQFATMHSKAAWSSQLSYFVKSRIMRTAHIMYRSLITNLCTVGTPCQIVLCLPGLPSAEQKTETRVLPPGSLVGDQRL